MRERPSGIETEYGFSAESEISRERHDEEALSSMMQLARERLVCLPAAHQGGIYLANGARLYVDTGNHPEFCTPECTDPLEVVRYVQAGDRILRELADQVEAAQPGVRLTLFRSNVDYNGSTWGSHESYLHRCDQETLAEQIVPHLVTRAVFGGAGGFHPRSPGIEFTLSPRAWYLTQAISPSSTGHRGIFHTKNESLSDDRFGRLHILCGDSLCSETARWLLVATTSLVVALAEAGKRPGEAVRLSKPLDALHAVARDPELQTRLPMMDGGVRTAIEIQRHYLAQAEDHADADFMPVWAGGACARWRDVLDRLERDPDELRETLDWSIKRALYDERIRRSGIGAETVRFWTSVLTSVYKALAGAKSAARDLRRILGPDGPIPDEIDALAPALRERGLSWDDLGPFMALRRELLEIDMRFARIGAGGIFTELDRAGALRHRIDGGIGVEEAVSRPPAAGRARVRGEVVRRLAANPPRARCRWETVFDDAGGRTLDLSDPFTSEERWAPMPERAEPEEADPDDEFIAMLLSRQL